jgi:N-methylhydantoinase A/oxoprolinase/acetone carboxylase beta subunit
MANFRIGIDVGGTFTHAVALEARALSVVAQARVPTTHQSERGVAEGVVQALRQLLEESGLSPEQVSFLAYSTTQVTNALLEGDVARVGIVAVGSGLEGRRAAKETRVGNLQLAPGKELRTSHVFLNIADFDETAVDRAVEELRSGGVEAIVAAEAFSVDDPRREQMIMARALETGLPATATHEITGRYGLRMRTRTAVINASLLPRAISTANLTEEAAREIGIVAPLMVVRSDGGVMSVEDMRRRPLLTLLSGPAAGVAAALMYARVSDGVFLEVGGTSTDISAIRHGRALLRTAEVGGHRLFLRTVDVRTIGVAGGSMPRVQDSRLHAVGPRSAHLAGLPYACFTEPEELGQNLAVRLISPRDGDPADYAVLESTGGARVAVTTTCAANASGHVPEGDFARGSVDSARSALGALGAKLGLSADEAARAVLDVAAREPAEVVEALIEHRGMTRAGTELIAGGGGASAIVPAVGQQLDLRVRVAENASVISSIGTALALVREVIERTVPEATEEDVLRIRREASEAVVRQGADPESISVDIEYDARSAVLRAVASGQTELRERDLSRSGASDEERSLAAAKSLGVLVEDVEAVADTGLLRAYRGRWTRKRLLGLISQRGHGIALVDEHAVVRLLLPGAAVAAFEAGSARASLPRLIEEETRYGDAGAELPQIFLGVRGRLANLSGLVSAAQVLSLADAELDGLAGDERVVAVAAARGV